MNKKERKAIFSAIQDAEEDDSGRVYLKELVKDLEGRLNQIDPDFTSKTMHGR